MDQSIGIKYHVSGQEKVFDTFAAIDKHLDSLNGKLEAFAQKGTAAMATFEKGVKDSGTAVGSLKGHIANLTPQIGGLASAMDAVARTKIGNNVSELSAGVKSARKEVAGLASDMGKLGKGGGPAGVVGGGGRGGGRGDRGTLGGLGALGFFARWHVAMAGLHAAHKMLEASSGATRKEIAEGKSYLPMLGFSPHQGQLAEAGAHKYAQIDPRVKPGEYLKTMAQTGSVFDVNRIGVENLRRINEASLTGSSLTAFGGVSPHQYAEKTEKLLSMYLMAQGAEKYRTIMGGGRADIKGMGNVNVAEAFEKLTAQVVQTGASSAVWAGGLAGGLQYAGPSLSQAGWSMGDQFALIGALVDAGFQGPKAGRAAKDIFARPEALAKLTMFGRGQLYMQKDKIKGDPNIMRQTTAEVHQALSSREGMTGFITETLGPALREAMKRQKDPRLAMSLIKDLGVSKEFLPQFMTMIGSGGFQEKFKDLAQQNEVAEFTNAQRQLRQGLQDTYFEFNRFGQSLASLGQVMGESKGVMASAFHGLSHMFNDAADKWGRQNRAEQLDEYLKTKQKTKPGADEPEKLGKWNQDYYDTLKQWGKLEWEGAKKDVSQKMGPRPGKDAMPYEVEAYDKQQKELLDNRFNEIRDRITYRYKLGMAAPGKGGGEYDSFGPKSAFEVAQANINITTAQITGFAEAVKNWFFGTPDAKKEGEKKPEQYAPPVPNYGESPEEQKYQTSPFKPASLETTEGGGGGIGAGQPVRILIGERELHGVIMDALEDVRTHNRQRYSGRYA